MFCNNAWWRHLTKTFFACVTGPKWGEITGHPWIPLTGASDAELWCFLWSAPKQTEQQILKTSMIWRNIFQWEINPCLLPATCLPSCPLTWCPSLVVTNSSQIKRPALRKAVAVRWRYDDPLWWHGIRLKYKKHHITYGIFWGQSIGDRWIHVTKGQQCGKRSHAMAPSCICSLSPDFIHQLILGACWPPNGNIFRFIGPLTGETTRHRWIPLTKANDAERLWSAWTNGWANNLDAGDFRRHHTHYHVNMMEWRKIHRIQTR